MSSWYVHSTFPEPRICSYISKKNEIDTEQNDSEMQDHFPSKNTKDTVTEVRKSMLFYRFSVVSIFI